jgi:hypothetical protein
VSQGTNEGSPSVSSSPITGAALGKHQRLASLGGGRVSAVSCFGRNADGPDETQKLSPDSSNDVRFVLAGRGQLLIARMQTVLRLPGNFLDIVGQVLLPSPQLLPSHGRYRYDQEDSTMTRLK